MTESMTTGDDDYDGDDDDGGDYYDEDRGTEMDYHQCINGVIGMHSGFTVYKPCHWHK